MVIATFYLQNYWNFVGQAMGYHVQLIDINLVQVFNFLEFFDLPSYFG